MFGNTEKTRYDFSFQLGGIPIRIHPFFWLIAFLFSPFLSASQNAQDMRLVLLGLLAWMAAWLLHFILHEMGHALVLQRIYGARPWIILYGFGGAACHQPYYKRSPGEWGRVLISFAGPGTALLAVVLLLAVLRIFGVPIRFGLDSFGPIPIPLCFPDFSLWDERFAGSGVYVLYYAVKVFLFSFIWMGLFWSLLNLLPIYPLDGGQIARALFQRWDRRGGIRTSLILSIAFSVFLLLYCLRDHNSFMAIFFGLFAWSNYQELSAYGQFRSGF